MLATDDFLLFALVAELGIGVWLAPSEVGLYIRLYLVEGTPTGTMKTHVCFWLLDVFRCGGRPALAAVLQLGLG
ncbi:hypothetical protein BJV77DRAFT_1053645 [Russula vinacea]|nr:hypothetical protein BJV77DRAFT_1053645 [Russula vinacea]